MVDLQLKRRLKTFFTGSEPDEETKLRIEAIKVQLREDEVIKQVPVRTWKGTIWDSLDKDPVERRFLFRLDAIMVTLACLGYFSKILDEQNITQAFVSGMKEDMGMLGDQLSNAKALYTAGYVIGQIPSNLLLTRISPGRWIPFCELGWALLTLAMYSVRNVQTVYAMRFGIGILESSFYPGMQFILGSQYRSDELSKRAIIFHTAGGIGGMFSNVLQASVYTNLNGVNGLAGWRWLFIVCAGISIPIALSGFVFMPNLPSRMTPNWLWSERDIAICQLRMELQGRQASQPWTKAKAKKVFFNWRIWILPPLYCYWNNAVSGLLSIMPLWLKAWNVAGQPIVYTVQQINHYPMPTTGITVVTAIGMAWLSDGWLKGRRWPMQIVSSGWALTSAIILICIPVFAHKKLHFYIFYSFGCLSGQSGMILTWINELCSHDQELRAITVAAANDFAYLMQIWENLTVWRTTYYPAARPGTIFSIAFLVTQILWIGVILWFVRRERRSSRLSTLSDDASGAPAVLDETGSVDRKDEKDELEAVVQTEEIRRAHNTTLSYA